MTLFRRRFLRIISLVIFAALAPAVILYALGYRIVSTENPASAVGVVLIESVPRAAQVYVDGKYVGRSPESVAAIDQRRVDIEVTAEGYHPWEKTLAVAGGETIEVRDIRLFPTESTEHVILNNITQFSISPDRSKVCAVEAGAQLLCMPLDTEGVARRSALPSEPVSILWSPDSQRLLLHFEDDTYAVARHTVSGITSLPQVHGGKTVVWDPRIATRLLYLNAAGVLLAYDTTDHVAEALADRVLRFATSARRIITISEAGTLSERTFSGTIVAQSQLPSSLSIQRLLVTPQGRVALLGSDGDVWVRQENGEYAQIIDSAVSAEWSPDGTHLALLTPDNGISVANIDADRSHVEKGRVSLVQRLSTPIQTLQWFAGSRHVLLQVGDEIRISEIDARDHPHIHTVGGSNLSNTPMFVGKDGEDLYYLRVDNGATNLIRHALTIENPTN